jgi:polyisoprenoid-binding protein YceI
MNRKTLFTLSSIPVAALFAFGIAATSAPQSAAPASASGTAGVSDSAVYKIDDVHSSALFRVHHLGAGQFWGRFNSVSGTMTFGAGGAPVAFDIAIATESVDTAEPKLDGHLKSPDFFNVKEFPSMTFKSTAVTRKSDGSYEVAGTLSMHGVTKPITAAIEVTGIADMGMGARAGVEAVFTVKRSDFGMKYGLEKGTLGDAVRVVVGLEGVRN